MKTYKMHVRAIIRTFPYVVVGHGLLLASVGCCGLMVLMVVVVMVVGVGISYIDSNKIDRLWETKNIPVLKQCVTLFEPMPGFPGCCGPLLAPVGLRRVFMAHVSCHGLVVLVVVVVDLVVVKCWLLWALIGPHWPALALIGCRGPVFAFGWPWLAFVDCGGPALARLVTHQQTRIFGYNRP